MYKIRIYESSDVVASLHKLRLLEQYRSAKNKLESGMRGGTFFKKRQPILSDPLRQVYYFRINQQYRAWCRVYEGGFLCFAIDDHQH